MTNANPAWILQCIYHAEKADGATLRDIVAYADYINRAILTYEEINDGLQDLSKRGLVTQVGEKFVTSSVFKTWRKEKFKKKGHVDTMKELGEIGKFLERNTIVDASVILSVDPVSFGNAVNVYLKH